MTVFSPSQLATWTGGRWTAPPVQPLTGFTMDTRQLRYGQVFVALRTARRDGHDFLLQAAAVGASAALVATANPALALPQLVVPDPLTAFQTIAREHRRGFSHPVVGISGSAGKTSTKNLLARLLGGEAGGVLATEGNLNNHIGVPLTLTRLDPARHRFAVVEAGISEPGEMSLLAGMIEPDLGIITLVAPAHVEALGSIEGVAAEKALLLAAVKPAGVGLYPHSADQHAPFAKLKLRKLVVERADIIRPETPPEDRVYFTVTHREAETAIALAYGPPPPLVFTLTRVSEGMAQNAVLAICAALWLGIERERIQQRLNGWAPGSLRGEVRRADGRLIYADCYNANPASMTDALEAFRDMAPADQPRLLVLGGMEELGPEAAMFHRALGRALRLRSQDRAFAIGDHAAEVCAGAAEAGLPAGTVQAVGDLAPVRAALENFTGSVFLKGSRRYQLETLLAPARPATTHA